jgi:hypothetical protein
MIVHKPELEQPVNMKGIHDCGCLYYCKRRLAGGYAFVPFMRKRLADIVCNNV